ncbi:PRC-barrel domain containing protein [Nonomuraea sp. SYSU D8015]|uniref:PRC-barrel domain containing protein n=1 Tax=Nonomuraea sp. SYSU D8015 TaxID=2593644 RepID=UPI001660D96F|nr:PRC-barrel domain containing protein [Nonomuraea sp. SYSU D8015]
MTTVTELIGQSVWDANGVWVGHVVDIRVVKHKGELQQSHTVYGLVVSSRRAPLLLGLTRDCQGRSPWLSRALARVVYAGCRFVPWSSVADYGDGEVHINVLRQELNRV